MKLSNFALGTSLIILLADVAIAKCPGPGCPAGIPDAPSFSAPAAVSPLAPSIDDTSNAVGSAVPPMRQIIPLRLMIDYNDLCKGANAPTQSIDQLGKKPTTSNAEQVLSEEFCRASKIAVKEGDLMAEKVNDYSRLEISDQCHDSFSSLKTLIESATETPKDKVLMKVDKVISDSDMPPQEIVKVSQICLSMGYQDNNMTTAIASALLLVAAGQDLYGELIGDHLALGIGVNAHPELALSWLYLARDSNNEAQPLLHELASPLRLQRSIEAAQLLSQIE